MTFKTMCAVCAGVFPAGQLQRVVTPPCINLAPTGTPSNKPASVKLQSSTAAGGSKAKHKNSSSNRKGGKGPGSKAGVGMKSCESFVVSPDVSQPLLAFLGDNGHIGLVSLNSRSSVGSLKMNGTARAAAFSNDGRTLVSAGEVVCSDQLAGQCIWQSHVCVVNVGTSSQVDSRLVRLWAACRLEGRTLSVAVQAWLHVIMA